MKNKLSIAKLFLLSAWLVSTLACGAAQQSLNGGNSSNAGAGNGNSNTSVKNGNSTTNAAENSVDVKSSKKDPKAVCDYLPGLFTPAAEYKPLGDGYSCLNKKQETLDGGKILIFEYAPSGDASEIKSVKFIMMTNGSNEENVKAEERLMAACETLWQKTFDASLPNDIKELLLKNKGKMVEDRKEFKEPVFGWVSRSGGARGVYSLELYYSLPQK